MPNDLGGHALPPLALGPWVDRQSEIRMGLDVDESGCDRKTFGVDGPGRTRRKGSAHSADPAVSDRHVSDLARPPAAIDDEAAAEQDVPIHGLIERRERGRAPSNRNSRRRLAPA